MEKDRSLPAPAAIRAVRSLERNRRIALEAEERFARARDQVRAYMALRNVTSVRLGGYQVDLMGEDLLVTRLPADGFTQLELIARDALEVTAIKEDGGDYLLSGESVRDVLSVRPEDIFTDDEAETLKLSEAGYLPCPRCGQRLQGMLVISEQISGILLVCPDVTGCGFKEF